MRKRREERANHDIDYATPLPVFKRRSIFALRQKRNLLQNGGSDLLPKKKPLQKARPFAEDIILGRMR